MNLKQKPLIACPEIAPACGNFKDECLKAAENLEKQYQGCKYSQICENCDYKTELKDQSDQQKLKDIQDCGPAPRAPGNWICKDGKWRLNLLLNSGFEETVLDKDKTFDPARGEVCEGKTASIAVTL